MKHFNLSATFAVFLMVLGCATTDEETSEGETASSVGSGGSGSSTSGSGSGSGTSGSGSGSSSSGSGSGSDALSGCTCPVTALEDNDSFPNNCRHARNDNCTSATCYDSNFKQYDCSVP